LLALQRRSQSTPRSSTPKLILMVEDNDINRGLEPGRFEFSAPLDWHT
jgi:hypothetical protein